MDPDFGTIIMDLVMAMFAKADSIISSNLIAGAVVGAAIVVVVAEVGSSAVVAKCSISLIDHRRIEVEEDRVADSSEVAGLG